MAVFGRVTIVGLGLIGGSLGIAIRRKHLARTVAGFSRKPATLAAARRKGAIDAGFTDLRKAVEAADLVVLATPVETIVPLARRIARWMKPGSTISDVGSTKAAIVRALGGKLGGRVHFVGAHPIAGSEQRGIGAASNGLFDNSLCILTPVSRTSPAALKRVELLWRRVCGKVSTMSPQQHDRLLAATSHLPHVLAFSLAASAAGIRLTQFPPSFMVMTRIAGSDPQLWDDILLSNRAALLRAMDRFSLAYARLYYAVARRNRRMVLSVLKTGKANRDAISRA